MVIRLRRVLQQLSTSASVRYGALCVLLLLMFWGWISIGAEGGSYQAFPLQHKKAAEIQPLLTPLLQNLQPPPHLIADSQGNQILLRGSDKAQQIVRQFLASVDRPPAGIADRASGPTFGHEPVVQGYPVPREQLAETQASSKHGSASGRKCV